MRATFLVFESRLNALVHTLASLLLALICTLGLWQVVTRFLLAQPSTWTEEAMRRLLIWAIMLGVVVAFRRGAMISVDLMLRVSKGQWHQFVRRTIAGVSLLFLTIVLVYGIDLVWRVRFQTFASMTEISMSWGYAALPVGAALSILAVIGQYLDPVNEELESTQ